MASMKQHTTSHPFAQQAQGSIKQSSLAKNGSAQEHLSHEQAYLVEKNKIVQLEQDLLKLDELLEHRPSRFSLNDVARAFFGSLVFGFTFALKGGITQIAVNLTIYHLLAILLSTITLITLEIYYIGYRRVPEEEKKVRKFGQFWLKRASTYLLVSFFVSFFLVYIYNLNQFPPVSTFADSMAVVICIMMPASIGATIADLLKQY
ncbi:MAG: DUF2391 family protein [Candidatus Woesearchaeota archaeon]